MTGRASLQTVDGSPVLRFERVLHHPPAKVWRAVTDPAQMAHWFPAAVEADLRPGAPMRFTFAEDAVVADEWEGEVLEVDEPRVYMFRWNEDVLRFELIPHDGGCRLVFTQRIGGGWVGRLGAGRTAAGWDTCLDAMVAQLDGEPAQQREDWLGPIERYVEEFGLGAGTVRAVEGGHEVRFARDLVWKPVDEVWGLLVDNTTPVVGGAPPTRATTGYFEAGRVTAVDETHELEYEWLHDGAPAGRVRWTVVADEKLGVRVELTQTVPAARADMLPVLLASWQVLLESFFAATHGDIRCPWPEDRVTELTARYRTQLG